MLRKTGKWAVLWFAGGLTFVLSLGLAVSPASAAFTFNWSSPGVISLMDSDISPPGTPVPDSAGQNITDVWWGWASNVHYFRMDLAGTPTGSDFASLYGIHADFVSGFGDPITGGIDTLLLSQFNGSTYTPVLQGWNGHMNVTLGEPFLSWSGFDFQASGNTLEWKIGGPATIFNWYGTTFKDGVGLMDVSSTVTTPIPSAAWLLGSGVVALIGLRRRKVQRYSFS